jgi:protease I
MSEQPAASPATNAGSTRPAGKGVDDEQLSEQVADQTDSNLEVEGAFERESGGAASDTEAAKASGDELK